VAPLGIQIGITAGSSSVARGGSAIPNLLSGSEDFRLPAASGDKKNSNWDRNFGNLSEATAISTESAPTAANRPGELATDLSFPAGSATSGIRNNFLGPNNRYILFGSEYTFSLWVKETPGKTSTRFRFRIYRYQTSGTTELLTTPSLVVGSSWVRHSVSFTIGAGGDFSAGENFAFGVISAGSAGAGNNPGITIFGAMLNEGLVAAPYIFKDTNLPPPPLDPGANNPYLPTLIAETEDPETGGVFLLSESLETNYLITES
jgi:hypothetical protein